MGNYGSLSDLDGNGADVLKDLERSQCTECPVQRDMPSNSFFSGQSVTIRSVQGPDGVSFTLQIIFFFGRTSFIFLLLYTFALSNENFDKLYKLSNSSLLLIFVWYFLSSFKNFSL